MSLQQPVAIQVDGLVKRYDDRHAIDGLSFKVERGEIFGLLGHNGAGKRRRPRIRATGQCGVTTVASRFVLE